MMKQPYLSPKFVGFVVMALAEVSTSFANDPDHPPKPNPPVSAKKANPEKPSVAIPESLLKPLASRPSGADIQVEILEGEFEAKKWTGKAVKITGAFSEPAFALAHLPRAYAADAVRRDRTSPFVVRLTGVWKGDGSPRGWLLRSRNAARLWVDERLVLSTPFINANASGHESVPPRETKVAGAPDLGVGQQEAFAKLRLPAGEHWVVLEAMVGGKQLKAEVGELLVAVENDAGYTLIGTNPNLPLAYEAWGSFTDQQRQRMKERDLQARRQTGVKQREYWTKRHAWSRSEAETLPRIKNASELDAIVSLRLAAGKSAFSAPADDLIFLRRIYLDTVGVIPTLREIETFLGDQSFDKRNKLIDRLLADSRWTDPWVAYWQDILAENPGILKPTLNNTGPFRWWIHESLVDNKPIDQFVTELIQMSGSVWDGGPAGFGIATENDAPMVDRSQVLARAFLAADMQCARCHDAPYHPFKQKDLFALAALLNRGPQPTPKTSTVPLAERERRPLVKVTLEAGTNVAPAWPFRQLSLAKTTAVAENVASLPAPLPASLIVDPKDTRELLAAHITSPNNGRFAQVVVNRIWKRHFTQAIVEPVDDWTNAQSFDTALLDGLANQLIYSDYDIKAIQRILFQSKVYQQAGSKAEPALLAVRSIPRRMLAEQIVDSALVAAGKNMGCEILTFDPEGRRPEKEMLNLGIPTRAWQMTSLSNERDRPALALPMAQTVVDVLEQFGWRSSRQSPTTVRESTPTPLQTLTLANGIFAARVVRLSDDSTLTELCLRPTSVEDLVEKLFLTLLTRRPTLGEAKALIELLNPGYASRIVVGAPITRNPPRTLAVSWANHLSPEATKQKLEMEQRARDGDPPTQRLNSDWRTRAEDAIWALVNSPEFIFIP